MPSKRPKFISIVIPSYNQEKTIVGNLKRLHTALLETNYEYEIIVVVDGKVDATVEKIRAAALPKTTLVYYKKNRGKSYAIRLGMGRARGEHIMFIDAGNEIDPEGMQMLFLHLQWYDADIIVGSKRHMASLVNYTWQRKMLSWGYYIFVKLLFGLKIRDTQAGIKVFRKEVLEAILPRLIEKRFAGDLEMLVVAKKMGFKRIFEAPIKLDYNFADISSATTINSIFHIILDTLAIYYRSTISGYYDTADTKTREPVDIKITRY
jgi:glycosyltransferase involved in cell wall biosynthesis